MPTHHIIDRRKNQKGKSSGNRRKFLKRVRKHVKQAARDAIMDGDIKSITSNKGRKVNVPVRDLQERHIVHGEGGDAERVYTGNDRHITGDRIKRPEEDDGAGRGGSADGEGEDSFSFELTKDEFLDLFFEDLELPDLVKEQIKVADIFKYNRAGFVTDGTPARLSVIRSMRQAKGRRKALRGPKLKKLAELEEELLIIVERLIIIAADPNRNDEFNELEARRVEVEAEIAKLKRRIKAIPFVDEHDLRFKYWKKTPQPTTQAVMFCVMDVSASMGEWEKEMSKRFFMLLYLFLTRSYERVDLVFVRHHTIAKEVDEDEFFHSRETGGTLVSPALELMNEIIKTRYPVELWNIYGCQASDGDNWPNDTEAAKDILNNQLLRLCQYYAYVEIADPNYNRGDSDLWGTYEEVRAANSNFDMTVITDAADIFPVFSRLFEKGKTRAR